MNKYLMNLDLAIDQIKEENFSLRNVYTFYHSIPEEEWCINVCIDDTGTKMCAIGQFDWNKRLTKTSPKEYKVEFLGLMRPFLDWYHSYYYTYERDLVDVNNGNCDKYQQGTPKQRVLAYFKDLIDNEYKEFQARQNTVREEPSLLKEELSV